MRVGVMQPYFLPYIGYWQLLNAVDKYVVFDDVNFIKKGWINRNRILINGKPRFLNAPTTGISQNKHINEIGVNHDVKTIDKNLKTIEMAYKKAPFFQVVYPMVDQILHSGADNIADYISDSLDVLCDYMHINTVRIMSSSIDKDNSLKGQDKILDICERLGATEYYNAIGGRELYDFSEFERRNIKLCFLETGPIEYKQFDNIFEPNLSILDVMMFNSVEEIQSMLQKYHILSKQTVCN